jgi:hypothetical protein
MKVENFRSGVVQRIPTGFWPKAQGCEARATLGRLSLNPINRNAVVANAALDVDDVEAWVGHNPVGVETPFDMVTQGSSFLATLGWRKESLWDCQNALPYSYSHAGGAA